jgi:rhamnopyranosyl-N-acetylglucosaminyl-diphospho-decaprenol beta-1,3/1,4-galactofuranosyltransferase
MPAVQEPGLKGHFVPDTVAVAAVTFDRPDDVRVLLSALAEQSQPLSAVALVDSGTKPVEHIAAASAAPVRYVRSEANLGGAGGFALAILQAVATGADWIWIMDDDARPESADTLATLLQVARKQGLDVVSPLVVSPADTSRMSFRFRLGGRVTYERALVEAAGFFPDTAQLFNGALIRSSVFFRVGLPDIRLFIRGDEVDYLLRLKKYGVRMGLTPQAAVLHPSGAGEEHELLGGRVSVIVPDTPFKQYFAFRNRGYLARTYPRAATLAADAIGYPLHFLRRGDLRGLSRWARLYASGVRAKSFGPPSELDI